MKQKKKKSGEEKHFFRDSIKILIVFINVLKIRLNQLDHRSVTFSVPI